PEPVVESEADFQRTVHDHSKPILGWHPVVEHERDLAQTRAAMRALGIQKIVVTPTDNGWTFSGDGNLAGMVSGNREPQRAPKPPRARRRPRAAGEPLGLARAVAVVLAAASAACSVTAREPRTTLADGAVGTIAFRISTPASQRPLLTRSYLNQPPTVISGVLSLLASSALQHEGRSPAVILAHGTGGVSDEREYAWAKRLNSWGIAAFIVDSYTGRGITPPIYANQPGFTNEAWRRECRRQGGHVGGDSGAREASIAEVQCFLADVFGRCSRSACVRRRSRRDVPTAAAGAMRLGAVELLVRACDRVLAVVGHVRDALVAVR